MRSNAPVALSLRATRSAKHSWVNSPSRPSSPQPRKTHRRASYWTRTWTQNLALTLFLLLLRLETTLRHAIDRGRRLGVPICRPATLIFQLLTIRRLRRFYFDPIPNSIGYI